MEDFSIPLSLHKPSNLIGNYITVDGCILPELYHKFEKDIKQFEVFDSDVWICGFPRTGTTWISEIAWLIAHDLDFESAKALDYYRTRTLDLGFLFGEDHIFNSEESVKDSIEFCKSQPYNPRQFRTHIPFSLLPDEIRNGTKKPKIIYTTRNPLDCCVSNYHFYCDYLKFSGTFEDFCHLFLTENICYSPFSKHVLKFWEMKDKTNMLFLTYEEMKNDINNLLHKVANFLGKTLSENDIEKLRKYVSFDSMKNNPAVNKKEIVELFEASGNPMKTSFIRSGIVGGYKSVMSPDLIAQFHNWTQKKFSNSGFHFPSV